MAVPAFGDDLAIPRMIRSQKITDNISRIRFLRHFTQILVRIDQVTNPIANYDKFLQF
jgi:hypothetical protein